MKKFFKITSLVLIIILLITAFTACGGDVDNKSPLVGEWKSEGGIISLTFVFEKNGKGREEAYIDGEGGSVSFTYEDKGTSVSIKYDSANAASERPYLIKGDCLIIADNYGGYLKYVRNGGEIVDPTAEELKEIFGIEEEDIRTTATLKVTTARIQNGTMNGQRTLVMENTPMRARMTLYIP